MGQEKTHGQEEREKEKDRDKKSCWEKKRVAGCVEKKARNYKEKAQAVGQRRRQQQGKGTRISPPARAAPQNHGAVLGSSCRNSPEPFLGSWGCFFATPDPAAIRSGINRPRQECAAAPVILPH